MKICRLALLMSIALTTLSPPVSSQDQRQGDVWGKWTFLIGSWIGIGSGQPGEGTGSFSLLPELSGRILVRKSHTEYPPGEGGKSGIVHDDLMIVYPEGSRFRAVYFDNEGHVIHYSVTFPAKQPSVSFESEDKSGSPRFRLDYEAGQDDELQITFSIAPPGQQYKAYLRGKARRNK